MVNGKMVKCNFLQEILKNFNIVFSFLKFMLKIVNILLIL